MNLLLISFSICCSAGAQVLIKFSSRHHVMSLGWIAWLGGSVILYGISFILYSVILKTSAISRVSPVMTIGTAAVVIAAGILLFGEQVALRQVIGLTLGVVAILLMILK